MPGRFLSVDIPDLFGIFYGKDGWVVACTPDEFNSWHGEGTTTEEVVSDLQASLIELYLDLDAEKDRLGSNL